MAVCAVFMQTLKCECRSWSMVALWVEDGEAATPQKVVGEERETAVCEFAGYINVASFIGENTASLQHP